MRRFNTILVFLCLIIPVVPKNRQNTLNREDIRVYMLFAGDAMQHIPQILAARNDDGGYSYDSCFYLVKDKIIHADLAGINFETTLGGKPYTGYPTFSSPDEFAVSLKDAGFDIFFLANNHAVDRGQKGLERTISFLDSVDIKHTGTFKSEETRDLFYPLIVIKNGIRIAFLNYTYDTNGLKVKHPNIINLIDTVQIKRDLHHAKFYNPDIIIAQMHWGNEYQAKPSAEQRKLAKFLQNNGVRIIIGHHPHVIQPIEINKEDNQISSVTYYSLGNFISNQQGVNTDGGMLAEIIISKQNGSKEVIIESVGYSLIWVEKKREGEKIKYRLIPAELINLTGLDKTDKTRMNTFLKNAENIIAPLQQ